MALFTVYDLFGGDSDLSDVPSDKERNISTLPTRNTTTKQKLSPSKLKARLPARGRSQSHGNLTLATTNDRPARWTRPRSMYTRLISPSSGEVSPVSSSSPPPFVASGSRKRKTRPSEGLMDIAPAKRQKNQERSLVEDLFAVMEKTTTPRKPAPTEFPIGFPPSQRFSRQEEWDLWMLQDAKVFVKLLRTDGSPATPDAPFAEVYWWPARSSGPVSLDRATATLYGNDGSGRDREVCLSTVLNSTIQTVRPSERNRPYRFTSYDFAQTPIPSTLQESFRKAFQEAMDDDRDDEPLDLDTIRAKALQTREYTSSPVRATASEQNGDDKGHHWEPPPPPENLMIPGEPVLCRHGRSEGHTGPYWPARVMKYIPPKHHNGQAKYEVHFFDRETAKVSRDHFFTCFEEGFNSCTVDLSKLHRWHQVNGADESLLNRRTPPGTRTPSPEPLVPLSDDGVPLTQCPGPHKPFTQLTPREQLACFAHILQLIILDKYAPTHDLNMEWMAGGKSRQAVQLRVGMKGNLTDGEGGIVTAQVRRWALRDERWASEEERNALKDAIPDEPIDVLRKSEDQNTVVQEGMSPLIAKMDTGLQIDTSSAPGSIQRPRGSLAYESLSRIDRSGYSMDVLIPEAIVQLLLWRNGDRTKSSPGPLPNPQDEAELREKGLKMRDESEKQSAWIGAVVEAWKATRSDQEMKTLGRPTKGRGAVEE